MLEAMDDDSPPRPQKSVRIAKATRLTAVIVASALFMQNLDSTVIATALPTMARAFGSDPVHMNVALTAYLLSLAVFIPASGWMADRHGTRNVFRAAIAVFTVGSILCGQAHTLGFLVFARIVQGMGGAMMVPVGRLVVLRTVAKSELVSAMAWLTMPALLGPVIGPPLGGFIVTYFDWPWIFYINIPIGILGIVAISLFIADYREPVPKRFDGWGLLFSGLGLSGLMFGLETAGRGVFPLPGTASMIGIGIIGAVAYLLHARTRQDPLLDLGLLRLPSFAVTVGAGTLFRVGIGAIPFLLPLMLQVGFGRTAAQSGMVTFASSAGALVMKPATQFMLRRLGFRDTLIWNGALSAVLLALCGFFRPTWPAAAIYAVLLVGGFFRSLQFTAFNALAYADIPRARMSAATSLYSCIQQLSMTLGISAGAAALEISMALNHRAVPAVPDFTAAFLAVSAVCLLAAPAALAMPRNAGAELAGRPAVSGPR
jgi:EmrB/QacA subfamily drug resistance transporter